MYKSRTSSVQSECIPLHFDLQYTKSFPKPIFAVQMVDLMMNGVKDLAVVTLNGIHILQVGHLTVKQFSYSPQIQSSMTNFNRYTAHVLPYFTYNCFNLMPKPSYLI